MVRQHIYSLVNMIKIFQDGTVKVQMSILVSGGNVTKFFIYYVFKFLYQNTQK